MPEDTDLVILEYLDSKGVWWEVSCPPDLLENTMQAMKQKGMTLRQDA